MYDGVLLSMEELRTLTRACGMSYPSAEVALPCLRTTEDTVVRRRLWVRWDRFDIPTTEPERAEKEAAIRNHHRRHPTPSLDGAYALDTDDLTPDETFRATIRWLANRSVWARAFESGKPSLESPVTGGKPLPSPSLPARAHCLSTHRLTSSLETALDDSRREIMAANERKLVEPERFGIHVLLERLPLLWREPGRLPILQRRKEIESAPLESGIRP